MKVNIQEIVNAIDSVDDESSLFLNTETMRVLSTYDEDFDELYDEEDDHAWVALPSHREIDDYGCMVRFIEQKTDGEAREWLSNAIRGRGAFRMFRATLNRFDLTQQWYDFKDREHLLLAMDWCDQNGIEYVSEKPLPDLEDEEYDEDEFNEEEVAQVVPRVTVQRDLTCIELKDDNAQNLIYLLASYNAENENGKEDLNRAEEQVDDWMNMDSEILVAVDHGRWIGFVMAIYDLQGAAHVKHIYVRREFRKNGTGRFLLEHLLEKVKVVGNGKMDIDLPGGKEDTRGFLQAVGYRTVVSTRYGKGD